MEQVVPILFGIIISALIALLGKNREIGYGWSFALFLFLTPIIGLIIILFSKKKDIEFVDIGKEETNKSEI